MTCRNTLAWIERSTTRSKLILSSSQPLSVKQYADRVDVHLSNCTRDIIMLADKNVLSCLNPDARQNRVYGLTNNGRECMTKLRAKRALPKVEYFAPDIDWRVYGELCYSHRSAVIKALSSKPVQPYTIRRTARMQNASSRMNTSNVREVLRFLLQLGVVRKVYLKKRVHPLYILDENAKPYQELLFRAGVL